MKIIKDYLGHEIHKGDTVLYSEKASKGYRGTFTEGVVIETKPLRVLDYFTPERYKEEMEYHNRWRSCWSKSDGKHSSNVINLTALDIRERIDLND